MTDPQTILARFGKRLRIIRIWQRLSQKELAAKMRGSVTFIQDLEKGRKLPRWEYAVRLAYALNVDVGEFTKET